MKFMFLNCQSYSTARQHLENLVEEYDTDVLCLNETWQNANSTLKFKNWRSFQRPRGTDNHGGVAIFFRDAKSTYVAERCNDFDHPELEVVASKITTNRNLIIYVIVAYIPPKQKKQLELLKSVIKQSGHENVILMGDLNGKSQEWGNSKTDENGLIIEEILTENNLIIHNDGQATRRNSNSIIDLIISSAKLSPYVKTCDTLTHEVIRSDHIAIYSEIEIDKTNNQTNPIYCRPLKKIDWNNWRNETEEYFQDWLTKKHTDMELAYESFYRILENARDKVIPEKIIPYKKRKPRPCWWNEEVSIAKKHLNFCQKNFKKRNTPVNKIKLIDAENSFIQKKEEAQEQWSEDLVNQFERSKNSKEMWDAYRKLTKKNTINSILPLIDKESNTVFQPEEKCRMLEERFFEGKHLEECKFDENWKKIVEDRVRDIKEKRLMEEEESKEDITAMNSDIWFGEVEGAIQRLKRGKVPGPDGLPGECFIHSGEYMREALTVLFNKCWNQGICPRAWKEALVKFHRKPGKSDYYTASSYRPISLTQTICKLLESIILTRLSGYIESNQLLDQEQEGFRKNRSTTYAVGRLVQEVFEGYNRGEKTAAIFVDLASAYDSVWREGLLYKLSNLNIRGRMWHWICDYLTDRTARCRVDDYMGPTFPTKIGLPQGSVIAPTLFNVYIVDMFSGTGKKHCKFADDGTTWATAQKEEEAIAEVCNNFKSVLDWCIKWRMTVSLQKTEATVFSIKPETINNRSFQIGDKILPYNKTPKILGITLDEKMTFTTHIEKTELKANRALKVIREVKGIAELVSTKKLINIYQSMVRSIIEYGAFIWQVAKHKTSLEAIQRKGLALCLNLPQNSGREAMEVATGVLPLDLRLEEIAIRDIAKIQAKNVTHPLKQKLNELIHDEVPPTHISPIALALSQATDMETNTKVNIQTIEPELDYEEGSLYMSRTRPEYWSRLGSSKTRTKEQENLGRDTIKKIMMEAPPECTFAFTDGSCQTNPGPTGAGAIIYPPDGEAVLLKQAVSRHGTILLAELVAVLMVLEYIIQYPDIIPGKIIQIYSDSQSVVGILSMGWKNTSHRTTVADIMKAMKTLTDRVEVQFLWTPGHAGLQGNEQADRLAKEGAQEAAEMPEDSRTTTLQEVKEASHKTCMAKWQYRWDNSSTGRTYYEYCPSVLSKGQLDLPDKRIYNSILQLQTGYSILNAHRNRVGINVSPLCQCGVLETTEHYLLNCTLYEDQRASLLTALQRHCGIITLDIHTLLSTEEHTEIPNWRGTIKTELASYIQATDRFATIKPLDREQSRSDIHT